MVKSSGDRLGRGQEGQVENHMYLMAYADVLGWNCAGHRREKEKIGSLRLKVEEVVKNRRILDTWALQETQKGDISLKLDWLPVSLQADTGLAQPGIQGSPLAFVIICSRQTAIF